MYWNKNMFFVYGAEGSKATERAENLLTMTGFQYRLFALDKDYTRGQLQRLRPGTTVIPHIYHNTKYVGTVKELYDYLYNEVKEREHGESDGDTDKKE
jgi:glutaredoxin